MRVSTERLEALKETLHKLYRGNDYPEGEQVKAVFDQIFNDPDELWRVVGYLARPAIDILTGHTGLPNVIEDISRAVSAILDDRLPDSHFAVVLAARESGQSMCGLASNLSEDSCKDLLSLYLSGKEKNDKAGTTLRTRIKR